MTDKLTSDALPAMAQELRQAVDTLLTAIQAIARGEAHHPMETEFPLDHPVGALAASLRETAAALEQSRAERKQREAELNDRILLIEQQKQLIVDLSTPVIEVWTGVLALPLIGTFDSDRATKMTSALLDAVVALRASLVILDITGIETVDASIADHFLRMARTVRLLGADCVLSGVRPSFAKTIVATGIEVGAIRSFPTLGDALQTTFKEAAAKTRKHADSGPAATPGPQRSRR